MGPIRYLQERREDKAAEDARYAAIGAAGVRLANTLVERGVRPTKKLREVVPKKFGFLQIAIEANYEDLPLVEGWPLISETRRGDFWVYDMPASNSLEGPGHYVNREYHVDIALLTDGRYAERRHYDKADIVDLRKTEYLYEIRDAVARKAMAYSVEPR